MRQPIRVLLVEDNPGDADLTRETLESGKLCPKVAVCIDGVDAVDFLLQKSPYGAAEKPDLILLDINLPRLDGRQVLAEIKRHEALRQIPVIILTSSDAPQDIAKSYELGANCYVMKPVGLDAFQSIVRSVEAFWLTVVKLP